jgi:hypothetical protein
MFTPLASPACQAYFFSYVRIFLYLALLVHPTASWTQTAGAWYFFCCALNHFTLFSIQLSFIISCNYLSKLESTSKCGLHCWILVFLRQGLQSIFKRGLTSSLRCNKAYTWKKTSHSRAGGGQMWTSCFMSDFFSQLQYRVCKCTQWKKSLCT